MDLTYGTASHHRDLGNLPHLPVVNMFSETAPTETTPVLQSRPGLKASSIFYGGGAVRGLYSVEGVLGDRLFAVAGSTWYSDSTAIGTVGGTGSPSFGSYEDRIFLNLGTGIYVYDGTTATTLAFPDSADVARITVGASRLIAIRKNSGKLYWSDALDDDIEALDFATAENLPDNLKDVLYIGDVLVLFGTETVEFWATTTDADLPFQPILGRVFSTGIRDTGCAVKVMSTFAWITNNNQICIGTPDQIISEGWLQAKLENSTTASLWTFRLQGDEYLAVRLDDATYVMNSRSREWTEMTSYGETNWLPVCYEDGYFGTSADGRLLEWGDDFSDPDTILERKFRAFLPITSLGVSIFNLTLRMNPGQTPELTGDYVDPSVELRTSRDGGMTWTSWKARSMGPQGNYRVITRWNSLGSFGYPGMLIEIRVTDPVPFRVSGVSVNDPIGSV